MTARIPLTRISGRLKELPAADKISAALIGTGVVSDAEFAFLDGVTSAIQTQLDAKALKATTVNGHALSANVTIVAADVIPAAWNSVGAHAFLRDLTTTARAAGYVAV